MSTFRLDGDLLHIGEGTIKVSLLMDWLAETGTLAKHGYIDEWELDRRIDDAREVFAEELHGDITQRVDNAVDELTYLDYDADPYRYHDDNSHIGSVRFCPDAFCATAGRTETVIDILKGA